MKIFSVIILVTGLSVCATAQTQPQNQLRGRPSPLERAGERRDAQAAMQFNTGQAARLVIGQVNFTTENYGATDTLLGSPSGIAYVNGMLWVADANRVGSTPDNNRVLWFNDLNTYPTPTEDPTIIGNTCGVCRGQASLVLGQPDFVTTDENLTATGMRNPTGVASDGQILVVADTDNNRVLIWNSLPKANGQPPNVVVGQPNFTSGGTSVPPTATSLRGPEGVWLAGGKLFIADTGDNRILIYNTVPTTNNATADVVVGQPNFTSFVQPDLTIAGQTTAANNMQDPVSVTTDSNGYMYVSDLGQARVLIFHSIPTANNASADVVVGQPDMTSSADNNSNTVTNSTLDSDGFPMGVTPVLCQSNAAYAAEQGETATQATDSDGTVVYPSLCAATLSIPRFALSDGTRLYIADGGNDRVLVFDAIPTANGTPADQILGQVDEWSDNTGQNPDGSDALQTPSSLAWDGLNLYISDTYNRRIVVYTAEPLNIPLAAVRNAASLEIYGIGSVEITGTITSGNTITITVGTNTYTYTVASSDTLQTITDALVKQINAKPDPNVTAAADDATDTIVLTARVGGPVGGSIALAATVSGSSTVAATASGTTLNVYLEDPTSIAPGTLITIGGTNLCDTSGAPPTPTSEVHAPAYLPFSYLGCEIFIDGQRAALLYVSATQINAQMPWEYSDRTSVSLYSRVTHADGSVTVSAPIGVTIVPQNPGIFAGSGNDPRPGYVYHASSSANDIVSVDGTPTTGDTLTITIGDGPGSTTTTSYTYTVLATDTLSSIQQALVALINSSPPNPWVIASASNELPAPPILLTARIPGPIGENISIAQSVSTNASEVLTVENPVTCCDNIQGALVTPNNPAIPGETLYVLATGLGPTNPSDQNDGEFYQAVEFNPPAIPVDSILADGDSATILGSLLVPGTVGVYAVEFQILSSNPTDPQTQLTIAQQAFVSNVVYFPVGTEPGYLATAINSEP